MIKKDIELLEATLTLEDAEILMAIKRDDAEIRRISPTIFDLAKKILKDDFSKIFNAEILKTAIDDTYYCTGPGATNTNIRSVDGYNIHGAIVPYVTLGLYSMYRWVKSLPRRAYRQEVTDENFYQILLDILNDYGSEDKKSYKWDLLRKHAEIFSQKHDYQYDRSISTQNPSYEDYAKSLVLRELANNSIYFTDNDIEEFISDIKTYISISSKSRLQNK